jgi:threonine/homoserine/homoserine lactone efflux protein
MDSIIALIVATSILLGSPGPAPLALAACSASFGVRKSIPFYCGILLGLGFVILGTIFGVSVLFSNYPQARFIAQLFAAAYLIYVAYKIAMLPLAGTNSEQVNAPSLVDGFILNILNPKAYAAFLAIFSQFQVESGALYASIFVTAMISFLVAVIVDFLWLIIGGSLKRMFSRPTSARIVRIIMASLIVLLAVGSFWL